MTRSPISIRHLTHRPGPGFSLELQDLDLGPGLTLVQGPNGAGKTTLLRILATLTRPTRAEMTILGQDPLRHGPALRAQIGFSGHRPLLHGALTVTENLTLHAQLHGLEPDRVDQALDTWQLAPVGHRPVTELSHGQARRADLARATLHAPELLLLDEPTSGLDDAAAQALADQLTRLSPQATLLAAHGEPPLTPERTLTLGDGRLAQEARP